MGRDGSPLRCPLLYRCFNPRARMGRDSVASSPFVAFSKFQSTRPHGTRRRGAGPPPEDTGFNPRARMGRDFTRFRRRVEQVVSIHAPAWDATSTSGTLTE